MNANILVVGSGGIGCELLKVLYLYGYKNVSIVDLDTIDISNLNRQFFFSLSDVKSSKAEVAAIRYKRMIQNAKVKFYKKDIASFEINFFQKFDVVFNCLDNDDSRRCVSRLCVMSSTLLIDGGSAGLLGQSLYFDTNTECFDCIPQKEEEKIPICTIRSFPKKFEHCVTWAKEYLLSKFETWKSQDYENPYNECIKIEVEAKDQVFGEDARVQKINKVFNKLLKRKVVKFCKEDRDILKFIYHTAVIRCKSFGLQEKNFFETQSIIGDIIPSVSTTNSIVASMMVLSFLKKKNFFITNSKKLFLSIETYIKNPECNICTREMFILSHNGKNNLRDFVILVKKKFGPCLEVYIKDFLIYDKYYSENLDKCIPIKDRDLVYVRTDSQRILLYSHVHEDLGLEIQRLRD